MGTLKARGIVHRNAMLCRKKAALLRRARVKPPLHRADKTRARRGEERKRRREHDLSCPYTWRASISERDGSGIGARRGDVRRNRRRRGGRDRDGIRGGRGA